MLTRKQLFLLSLMQSVSRYSRRLFRMLSLFFGLIFATGIAFADVINIDFNALGSPTFFGQGVFLDQKGNRSSGEKNSFWNGVIVPTNDTSPRASGGLLMSDGKTPTGVTVTFTGVPPGAEDYPASNIPPSSAFALMQDGAIGDGQVLISGLRANSNYFFVLYGRSANPNLPLGTNFTFGGRADGAFVSTLFSQTGADAMTPTTKLTQSKDFALTNASTNEKGELRLSYFVGALNGMQIIGEFQSQIIFTSQTPQDHIGTTDGVSYELGMRFTPAVKGSIVSIRYWHPATLNPKLLITGKLYAADGTLLSSVDYPSLDSTALSGWRQTNLTTPIAVDAGKTYVVSVTTPGQYVYELGGLATTITSGTLLTAGAGSGVFGAIGAMPTNVFNNFNYFRDVVFVPSP
jgi:hypothetical protein